jgi:HPt (histidine-containing phosphotransfer) domain-containing protein
MKMKPKLFSEAVVEFQQASLRLGCRMDVYRQLLSMFLETCAGTVETVRDHLERNEFDAAERLVHTVKGMAGQVGAVKVFNMAARLESAIAAHSDTIPEELSLFQKNMDQSVEAVQNYLCSTSSKSPGISL